MKKLPLFVLLSVLLLVTACQPATAASTPPANPAPSIPASAEAVTRSSIAMLGDKFAIPAVDVTVSKVTPMTWPDASLGCPGIGVMYIQIVTPGFQILLEARGHVFTFHTDEKSLVVLCSINPPDEIYPTP